MGIALMSSVNCKAVMYRFVYSMTLSTSPGGAHTSCFTIPAGGTIYIKNLSTFNTASVSDPCYSNNTNSWGLTGTLTVRTAYAPIVTIATVSCSTAPGGSWNYNEELAVTLPNCPLSGNDGCSGAYRAIDFIYSGADVSPLCNDPIFLRRTYSGRTTATSISTPSTCVGNGAQVTITANNIPGSVYTWEYKLSTQSIWTVATTSGTNVYQHTYSGAPSVNINFRAKAGMTGCSMQTLYSNIVTVKWCDNSGLYCCIAKRETSNTNEEEEIVLNKITLHPNPSNGEFKINLYNNSEPINTVNIFDLSGKLIKSIKENNIEIVMARDIPNGLYYLEALTSTEKYVSKFSILK